MEDENTLEQAEGLSKKEILALILFLAVDNRRECTSVSGGFYLIDLRGVTRKSQSKNTPNYAPGALIVTGKAADGLA